MLELDDIQALLFLQAPLIFGSTFSTFCVLAWDGISFPVRP